MRRILVAAASIASLLAAQAAGAVEKTPLSFASLGSTTVIPATLYKPDGPGPFPAVVVLHDCSGAGPRSGRVAPDWAQWLAEQGYVVLLPDSFAPRGFPDGICGLAPEQTRAAAGNVRAADAYGALLALRGLPFVDGRHIGLLGGSHGGWGTLVAMSAPARDDGAVPPLKRNGFTAAVAIYPNCGLTYGGWAPLREKPGAGAVLSYSGVYVPVAPLLILAGAEDDMNPAEPCRQMVETSHAAGYPIAIKVYPDAHHLFDSDRPLLYEPRRLNPNLPSGYGTTTGGNAAARADARKEVAAFFAHYLKPR